MASDKIEIKVTADTREAERNLSSFTDKAKAAAAASSSIGSRAWKTLNTDISQLNPKMTQLAGSAARVGIAVAGGVAAVGAAAYKIAEFAASIEQQEMAINRLGPAYEAVRAATAGVVSAQDALKAQQTLVQSGLRVSAEQLGTITRAAREYARATGTETTQALEQLTDALRTGSSEGLGRFGVSLQQGVTGAAAYTSALAQMTTQQERTTVSARTMREDLDKLPEGLSAIGTSILSMLQGPGDALIGWLTGLGGASMNLRGLLSEIAGAGDTLRQRERQAATDAANTRRLEAQEQLFRTVGAAGLRVSREQMRGLSPERIAQLQAAAARIGQVQSIGAPGSALRGQVSLRRGGAFRDLERQTQFEDELQRLMLEQRTDEAMIEVARQGTAVRQPTSAAARAARAAAAASQQATALATAKTALVQAQTAARTAGARVLDIDGPLPGEQLIHFFARATYQQQMLNDVVSTSQQRTAAASAAREQSESAFQELRQSIRAQRADERAKAEAGFAMQREAGVREARESFGGRFAGALGIELDEQGRVPALDALQGGVELLQGSLQTLTSGFSQLFNTLAAGSMSAGEAFQQFAAKTLSSLGEMAVNKGVFYTFEGIASLFTNPVAAPLYFAAGAGLIALGVGLGAAGSAVAPSTGASAGSSAPAAARAASGASPRSEGSGGNVTIVLSSLVPPGPRELQGLVHAQRQAGRYGLDDARMVPRQVRA